MVRDFSRQVVGSSSTLLSRDGERLMFQSPRSCSRREPSHNVRDHDANPPFNRYAHRAVQFRHQISLKPYHSLTSSYFCSTEVFKIELDGKLCWWWVTSRSGGSAFGNGQSGSEDIRDADETENTIEFSLYRIGALASCK